MAREIPMVAAINEALHVAMAADPDVIVLGEDVAGGGGRADQGIEEAWGGIMGATRGLFKRFGPSRVRDTPISEMGFLGVALDPLLNQAAKLRYMFGGKARVPLTVRTVCGAGMRAAAQHSQSLYWMTTGIPGLKTVIPSNPADAKGLLLAAIRDDDPVIFCEAKGVLMQRGEVPEGDYTIPIGQAKVVRAGGDVTLVAFGATVAVALAAAEQLAREGTEAEVLDLRSLQPLDEAAILGSLEKTGRLVVVDESTPRCGIASDVAALCVDRGFDFLNAPVKRVTAPHTPVPFAAILEDAFRPSAEKVIAAVREMG